MTDQSLTQTPAVKLDYRINLSGVASLGALSAYLQQ